MPLIGFGRAFGVLCLLVLIAGSSDSNGGRQAISGTVTLNGQPLDQGRIEFATGQKIPPSTGIAIENGSFSIPPTHGLVPGSYLVAIYSSTSSPKSAPTDSPPGESIITGRERIPAKYNLNTELKIDVTAGRENTFVFTLN